MGLMRIGIVGTRLAGVDGVTFEATKWETVLQELGHEIRLCSGEIDALRHNARLIPAMHFTYPPAARVTAAAFDPASDAQSVRREIDRLAGQLLLPLHDWLAGYDIQALVVENAWAIPMHLPLGVALRRLVEETGITAIGHHHDYWWERQRFAVPIVPDVLEHAFPPDLPNVRHVGINSLAGRQLFERRGLNSIVMPNVFDFDQPRATNPERVRAELRSELGMGESGLLVVQPTRVVPRKGIELAIELVARLEDPDAVLLITSPAGDEGLEYLVELERLADTAGVHLRYDAGRFEPDHEGVPIGPAHTLSEAYLAADLITYPSLYEGFGNALVEAVFHGKPTLVNRYPVYEADIRPLGLRFVEIDGAITDESVAQVRELLADPRKREEVARHNFRIGQEHLGYDVLRRRLPGLLGGPWSIQERFDS
jgi:glycosyltransferase involved in cell wall biosynthesis